MNRLQYIILSVLMLLMVNCKSSKTAIVDGRDLKLNTKQLIKENKNRAPVFKTLESKLKVTYSQNDNTQTHTVSFRLKKDEIIWMSAMFSVVKVLITPEKVSFYNKLDNTYFEGNFSYLSNLLGTEIDFYKLQNILIGEAIYGLDDNDFLTTISEGNYALHPKNQDELFEIFYIIDPSSFKLKSQQIHQAKAHRHLEIDYKSHQDIDKQILPAIMRIVALDAKQEVSIDLEFLNVSLNQDLSFPFKIPSDFKKIEF